MELVIPYARCIPLDTVADSQKEREWPPSVEVKSALKHRPLSQSEMRQLAEVIGDQGLPRIQLHPLHIHYAVQTSAMGASK